MIISRYLMQSRKLSGFALWLILLALGLVGKAANQPPVPLQAGEPVYPEEMAWQRIGGMVEVEFVIGSTGNVLKAKTIRTTNPAFNQAAEAAVLKWRYQPGTIDGKPANVIARQVFGFSSDTKPVYPFELLQAGVEGTATVEFSVDQNGRAFGLSVISASQPEFGLAWMAAIASSTHAPSFDGTRAPQNGLRTTRKFVLKGQQSILDEPSRQILRRLAAGGAIPDAAKLDQPLVAKVSLETVLPQDVAAGLGEGSAVIEAFVDEAGHVHLPRIDSATKDEFGYAAAQAVSGWKYEPPHIGGEPALVRTQIRVEFKAKN